MLDILYQDDALIAVNKPADLAVHRSKMVGNAEEFLIDLLREQVGDNVYLAHRLDRATSGVLLVARSKEVAAALGEQFMGRTVHKQYLVVVRGWPEPAEGSDRLRLARVARNRPAPRGAHPLPTDWTRSKYRSNSAAIRNSATPCCWPNRRAAASARSASIWHTSTIR